MRDINVTYKDGVTGEEYRIALGEFTAAAESTAAPVKVAATGSLNENIFTLEGTLGSIAQMTDPEGVYPVDLKAAALGVVTSYKGTLGPVARLVSMAIWP